MKENQKDWNSPAEVLNKVVGSDSNINSLVNLRRFLVDNLVLNQQEKRKFENTPEEKPKTKTVSK